MKQLKLLLLLVFVLTGLNASSYEPMLQDGRSWILSLRYFDHSVMHHRWGYNRFEVIGDSVITDIPCKIIIRTSLEPTAEEYETPPYYMYAFEEDGKLFYLDGEEWNELDNLLYYGYYDLIKKWKIFDFNLNIGDEVDGWAIDQGPKSFKVVGKDIINVCGVDRVRISMENDSGGQTYWVEGIGSLDLFYQSFPMVPVCGAATNPARKYQEGVDFFTHLAECRQDGEVIFQMENFFNPDAPFVDFDYAAVKEIPAAAPSLESGVVYDLQGRAVTNPQRGSIYIRNGRKIVWK